MFRSPTLFAGLLSLVISISCLAGDPVRSGEKFADPQPPGTVRALLAGGGSSHDFEKYFHQTDAAFLRTAQVDPAYTENVAEAIELLPQADVLVLSSNQASFGTPAFQEALKTFADAGKGVIILHPGAWYNYPPALGYNQTFVGGGAKSHDKLGLFTVTVKDAEHPVMKGVPASFEVKDELYQVVLDPAAETKILAETSTSGVTKKEHASVWTVAHPKARIVGIALGHDAAVHDLPAFQTILTNALRWAAQK